MLNKDLINHKFPGGSFTIDKEINNLIKSSTGLEISKSTSNEYLVHPIFSMVALNSIGYTLEELFNLLNYDVRKGPMLGECEFNLLDTINLDRNFSCSSIL